MAGLFSAIFSEKNKWGKYLSDMLIRAKNLCFSYNKKMIIKDLDLEINKGLFYGILGPNGCGKSTLIDLLTGLLKPESGIVEYKGRSIDSYSKGKLSKEIALVPQNFYINFPFTALDVVIMGRYPHMPKFSPPSSSDMKLVNRVMEITDTMKFKNRYMTEMSGGERQRIIFARALVQDTPVLMLDEATSNLDINHTLKLLNIVSNEILSGKKTVISVFQDINLAATYCDCLIFMKHGNIVTTGKVKEILLPDTIRKVFGVDSHIYFDSYSNSMKVSFKKDAEIH